jgi:hypothetical protein
LKKYCNATVFLNFLFSIFLICHVITDHLSSPHAHMQEPEATLIGGHIGTWREDKRRVDISAHSVKASGARSLFLASGIDGVQD